MRFLLTLDYELFFGQRTGSPDGCLIYPTRVLVELLERHGLHVTLFVDAGYLERLATSDTLLHQRQYQRVVRQLKTLTQRGHDVQLHIHPHWEDSHWDGCRWIIDSRRYRLQDFDAPDVASIVARYSQRLATITGTRPVAFRAGGWCLQPFEHIADALYAAGVRIDSTVFAGGTSVNRGREFDFSTAPDADHWRFNTDPLVPERKGRFLELPITAHTIGPAFYWHSLWRKFRKSPEDTPLGDGALGNSGLYYLRKLTSSERTVASIDGPRADSLQAAFREALGTGRRIFNVMGHPKSLTRNSLRQLDGFLREHRENIAGSTIRELVRREDTATGVASRRKAHG
ncbi:MAG: hypothetical protein R3E84_14875 [Pseudomonadales bacterium]